ncbi:MAG TPA: type II toxin-antitoxin system Phd/YefM family antitoxin [Longimicrobium sp.]|nr:type II toxin-antitoxin system Phd/YefM family antitoxin [Longimicrobium sp.]
MAVRMGAREARQKFSELLGRVHYGGETVILESSGKPMAAVIPLALYEKMMQEREARFSIIDRIRDSIPDYPEDEVDADIAEALNDVRMRSGERRT